MDFNRVWTTFALDAEVEAFGTGRIAKAHNDQVDRLERELNEERRRSDIIERDFERRARLRD